MDSRRPNPCRCRRAGSGAGGPLVAPSGPARGASPHGTWALPPPRNTDSSQPCLRSGDRASGRGSGRQSVDSSQDVHTGQRGKRALGPGGQGAERRRGVLSIGRRGSAPSTDCVDPCDLLWCFGQGPGTRPRLGRTLSSLHCCNVPSALIGVRGRSRGDGVSGHPRPVIIWLWSPLQPCPPRARFFKHRHAFHTGASEPAVSSARKAPPRTFSWETLLILPDPRGKSRLLLAACPGHPSQGSLYMLFCVPLS